MSASRPKVDCLMACKPQRKKLAYLRASLECFERQTFEGCRLLVLLNNGEPEETERTIEELRRFRDRARIEWEVVKTQVTLGAARNLLVSRATADLICQWDDDDFSHPWRVELQARALELAGGDVSLISHVTHLIAADRKAAICDWTRLPYRGHPATPLLRRSSSVPYSAEGPFSHGLEDGDMLERLLREGGKIVPIPFMGYTYIYNYHGSNIWDEAHHRGLLRFAPGRWPAEIQAKWREHLADFDFLQEDFRESLLASAKLAA
jgi:glycosyltransferase involved in cell wall biosynthesis